MANFNLNKVIMGGRLTADIEPKATPSGVSVAQFTIAINRGGSKDEKQVDFFNCVAWRNTAEFITKYFQKGKSILIVGSLQSRSWTDQNGQKRYVTEVVAEEAQFVERKTDGSAPVSGAAPAPYGASPKDVAFEEMSTDDDLPF